MDDLLLTECGVGLNNSDIIVAYISTFHILHFSPANQSKYYRTKTRNIDVIFCAMFSFNWKLISRSRIQFNYQKPFQLSDIITCHC